MASFKAILAIFVTFAVMMFLTTSVDAGYRKPPFNGSIFGKRSGNSNGKMDYIFFVEFLRKIHEF